jgi:hypothetical protein
MKGPAKRLRFGWEGAVKWLHGMKTRTHEPLGNPASALLSKE